MTHYEATGCDCEERMAARLDKPLEGDEASHFVPWEQFVADVAEGRFHHGAGG